MKNPAAYAAVCSAASIASTATGYLFAVMPDAQPFTILAASVLAIVFGLFGYEAVSAEKS